MKHDTGGAAHHQGETNAIRGEAGVAAEIGMLQGQNRSLPIDGSTITTSHTQDPDHPAGPQDQGHVLDHQTADREDPGLQGAIMSKHTRTETT